MAKVKNILWFAYNIWEYINYKDIVLPVLGSPL